MNKTRVTFGAEIGKVVKENLLRWLRILVGATLIYLVASFVLYIFGLPGKPFIYVVF